MSVNASAAANASGIRTSNRGDIVTVVAPFNEVFIRKAKELGGRWDAHEGWWYFPADLTPQVRDLVVDVYGDDGTGPICTVDIEFEESSWRHGKDFMFAGRPIVKAWGRDSGAAPVLGVSILAGEITTGGSVKNWTVRVKDGTIVRMRGVPLRAAEKAQGALPEKVRRVTIHLDRDALLATKADLEKRINELQSELDSINAKLSDNIV